MSDLMTPDHKTSPVGNQRRPSLLGLSILVLVLGLATTAMAKDKKDGEKGKSEYVVSKWAYKRLNEAHQLISKNKYNEAMKAMEGAAPFFE